MATNLLHFSYLRLSSLFVLSTNTQCCSVIDDILTKSVLLLVHGGCQNKRFLSNYDFVIAIKTL